MRPRVSFVGVFIAIALCAGICRAEEEAKASALKVHAIFNSNMVIQRGKPIKVWGWAKPGDTVTVKLGNETGTSEVKPEVPLAVLGQAEAYAGGVPGK